MTSVFNNSKFKLGRIILPNVVSRTSATDTTVKPPYFYHKQYKNLNETPWKEKSLAEIVEEKNFKDPSIYYIVNIGLPKVIENKADSLQARSEYMKKIKADAQLEKKSRECKLFIPLDEVALQWEKESAPEQIKMAADYYGIFQDLFGEAFFYPEVAMNVSFKNGDLLVPVCRGNSVKPSQALSAPEVMFEADPDSLWTLVVSNPDGHTEENTEYLHYLVGNIPGNDLSKGDIVTNYVQPFPARGTGFHRLVFILYKQTKKLDYSSIALPENQFGFKSRQFRTYDFYKARQDELTPAGLAFCQVDWDSSVSHFFHTVLEVEEPVYEYDFAAPYHPPEKWFPIRQPFNLYLDRYRDPKQIAKEYLLRKLKDRHPFEAPKPPLRYPNAVRVRHDLNETLHGRIPSWLRLEKLKRRMGYGQVNDY